MLEIERDDEELQSILPIITNSKVEILSLKCCRAVHAGGRLNDARYTLHSEINHLKNAILTEKKFRFPFF